MEGESEENGLQNKEIDSASESTNLNSEVTSENNDTKKEENVSLADTITPCEPEEKARENNQPPEIPLKMPHLSDVSKTKLLSSEELQRGVQELIDSVNTKRSRDTNILTDFKKALEMQLSKSCTALEEALVQSYEQNNQTIQSKLQEFFAVIERIGQLETELAEFKATLGALYTDINNV
ncbi:uncharacterized protein LOC5504230 [Nematostella vectensis]|uniref:uncharacterized protein LOC5504230 n=1 Tax=Nematostella vectensis TaxID=45351 RepID=UPI00138FAF99|nr:uncharacterized protein LOC5504230 [Nematostella vectensis]